MGRSIDADNTIAKMVDVAKIKGSQQQRDDTQRQQFALAMRQKEAQKESQVQTSHGPESAEINRKCTRERSNGKRKKRRQKKEDHEKDETEENIKHIDIVAD
ncbi:hypothetical protein GF312_21575 [Candidatus Poribacteria bacterium]|nr:hypothetical protein [Candidatus Poribacteria bacterium]